MVNLSFNFFLYVYTLVQNCLCVVLFSSCNFIPLCKFVFVQKYLSLILSLCNFDPFLIWTHQIFIKKIEKTYKINQYSTHLKTLFTTLLKLIFINFMLISTCLFQVTKMEWAMETLYQYLCQFHKVLNIFMTVNPKSYTWIWNHQIFSCLVMDKLKSVIMVSPNLGYYLHNFL